VFYQVKKGIIFELFLYEEIFDGTIMFIERSPMQFKEDIIKEYRSTL
jgi:hypothetical protein